MLPTKCEVFECEVKLTEAPIVLQMKEFAFVDLLH